VRVPKRIRRFAMPKTWRVVGQARSAFSIRLAIGSSHCELKEQASQIQKVSDQLDVSKPASQLVVNNQ
jgi:hypothetical protein